MLVTSTSHRWARTLPAKTYPFSYYFPVLVLRSCLEGSTAFSNIISGTIISVQKSQCGVETYKCKQCGWIISVGSFYNLESSGTFYKGDFTIQHHGKGCGHLVPSSSWFSEKIESVMGKAQDFPAIAMWHTLLATMMGWTLLEIPQQWCYARPVLGSHRSCPKHLVLLCVLLYEIFIFLHGFSLELALA